MARSLTDPLEAIPGLRLLRPAGAPGSFRPPRTTGRPPAAGPVGAGVEEGAETYDAQGHLHKPQPHALDLED